jgi:hypothetical protein
VEGAIRAGFSEQEIKKATPQKKGKEAQRKNIQGG